ncbi:MAG: Orange carotenoid protein [Iphinoe sp. HA4291-MV1]|jgi:hypothetical protein|nr:Orange carotenoid protein [Iphinoe sp. HA4291-MV1]
MTSAYKSQPEVYSETFRSLNVDNKLGVLWFLYIKMGGSTRPQDPSGTAPDSSEPLFNKVKQKSHEEQLQVMRDLLTGADTDVTQEYNSLTNNTKLALWYQLAQGMENSEIIQVPSSYQLSPDAKKLLSLVEPIGFEQQYVFLRDSLLSDNGKPSVG